jgi:hypothetical protein
MAGLSFMEEPEAFIAARDDRFFFVHPDDRQNPRPKIKALARLDGRAMKGDQCRQIVLMSHARPAVFRRPPSPTPQPDAATQPLS